MEVERGFIVAMFDKGYGFAQTYLSDETLFIRQECRYEVIYGPWEDTPSFGGVAHGGAATGDRIVFERAKGRLGEKDICLKWALASEWASAQQQIRRKPRPLFRIVSMRDGDITQVLREASEPGPAAFREVVRDFPRAIDGSDEISQTYERLNQGEAQNKLTGACLQFAHLRTCGDEMIVEWRLAEDVRPPAGIILL